MPRSELDPRGAQSNGTSWIPPGPIPISIRTFGFFPNIDDWLPGDLMLVASAKPDWVHRQISKAQIRRGYHADDARWQHAAVYLGDGYLCEAGTSGVRYVPVFDYVGEHLIRVRRDFTLSAAERWRLAIQAVVRLGEPYNFREILSIYRSSFSASWTDAIRAQFHRKRRSVICSQLYSDAFSAVTGRLLPVNSPASVTPAALSLTSGLQDVPLHWKQIV